MATAQRQRSDVLGTQAARGSHVGLGKEWLDRYSLSLVFVDAAAVMAAVSLAQLLRFGDLVGVSSKRGNWTYSELSLAIVAVWLTALAINHSRSKRVIGSGAEEYRRIWIATMSTFGAVAIVSMLVKLEVARGYLMIALPAGLVLLTGGRWTARQIVRRLRLTRGGFRTRVLAFGNLDAARDLAVAMAREPGAGYLVVGICVPSEHDGGELDIPGIGKLPVFGCMGNDVSNAVTKTESDAVAVTATERLDGKVVKRLSWDLEKLDVDLLLVPSLVDVAGPRLHMHPVAGLPLIHVEKPQYHGAQRFEKRTFDLFFSLSVLIAFFPILLAIAIAIKLSSRGPLFYRHERIGLNGETFKMIKFRTMVVGADSMGKELADLELVASPRDPFKFVDDPRVTRLGRYLRKYSLDELPQFINVIKGEMSVVGPRPQVESEVRAYDAATRRRLLVRPGITGLWQVSGRSDLSTEDSLRLDLFYVENWSMIADLLITLQTFKAVIRPSGAY